MKKVYFWLLKNDLNLADLANGIKCSKSHVRGCISTCVPMSKKMAQKIEEYTKGEITASYLLRESKRGMDERKRKNGSSCAIQGKD